MKKHNRWRRLLLAFLVLLVVKGTAVQALAGSPIDEFDEVTPEMITTDYGDEGELAEQLPVTEIAPTEAEATNREQSLPEDLAADSLPSQENHAHITIFGRLLDEMAEPLAGREVAITFFLGLEADLVTAVIETDEDGFFQLQTDILQPPYQRSNRYCVDLQATFVIDQWTYEVDYTPGSPREMSEFGTYDKWAAAGRYTRSIQLFSSSRVGSVGGAADFLDLTVQLGSPESPSLLQLERRFTITERFTTLDGETIEIDKHTYDVPGRSMFTGSPLPTIERQGQTYYYLGWRIPGLVEELTFDPPEVEVQDAYEIQYLYSPAQTQLTVRYLDGRSGEAVAEAERHLLSPDSELQFAATAPAIANLAPVRAELNGVVVAEAQPENPLSSVALATAPGELELIYYYLPDRDGDGIPDYEVTELYRTKDGETITSQPDQIKLYAHRTDYSGTPPAITGYQYIGFVELPPGEKTLPVSAREIAGLTAIGPQATITANVTYCYFYEKIDNGKTGGGNGGKDKPKPTEPPPGEEINDENEAIPAEPEPEPLLPEPPPAEEISKEPPAESSDPVDGKIQERKPAELEPVVNEPLTQKQREARRNITFVKQSYRRKAAPGEEITYSFTGFENSFPYALQEYLLADRPDRGLDFVSLTLPAFHNGAGVRYQVTFQTNQREERVLLADQPADHAVVVTAPELGQGEFITAISMHISEVPPGFGTGDEILITFRVGDDPPSDTLQNRGALFYKDLDQYVRCQSEEEETAVALRLAGDGDVTNDGNSGWLGPFPVTGGGGIQSLHWWQETVTHFLLFGLLLWMVRKVNRKLTDWKDFRTLRNP